MLACTGPDLKEARREVQEKCKHHETQVLLLSNKLTGHETYVLLLSNKPTGHEAYVLLLSNKPTGHETYVLLLSNRLMAWTVQALNLKAWLRDRSGLKVCCRHNDVKLSVVRLLKPSNIFIFISLTFTLQTLT
jgi:hypothetical protein